VADAAGKITFVFNRQTHHVHLSGIAVAEEARTVLHPSSAHLKCYGSDYLECDSSWFWPILSSGFFYGMSSRVKMGCSDPYNGFGGWFGFMHRRALYVVDQAQCNQAVAAMNAWGAGTFRCSQWPQRSWRYHGSTRRTDTQTRYIKLDRCSSQIANVNQERPVLVPGPPVNAEKWETCPSVAGTDVPMCPVNQLCNRHGHVGRFQTYDTPAGAQCHCLLDVGGGYPCHGNHGPCLCARKTQPITVAPKQVAREPETFSAGGKTYGIDGAFICPCPGDDMYAAPTNKALASCGGHCSSTTDCKAILWSPNTNKCWLDTSSPFAFPVHNANSFCPESEDDCLSYMKV
jgi:hypothetical protein